MQVVSCKKLVRLEFMQTWTAQAIKTKRNRHPDQGRLLLLSFSGRSPLALRRGGFIKT